FVPGINIRKALLNGGNQIPAPFQAALEGHKTTRESLAKNRHQKAHPAALCCWQVSKTVEMAAQVVDAVVQGAFGVGLEDHRDIFRLSSRQPAFRYPAFLVGSERRASVAEHKHGQRRLPCEVGSHALGLG